LRDKDSHFRALSVSRDELALIEEALVIGAYTYRRRAPEPVSKETIEDYTTCMESALQLDNLAERLAAWQRDNTPMFYHVVATPNPGLKGLKALDLRP
jgi:hypothetical protein